MLFNSAIFLVFFISVYILYWAVLKKRRLWLLLIAGCIFYGSWDWRFLLLLFFTSGVDFFAAQKIHKQSNRQAAKRWLILSVCINLLTLGFFKYYNFFVSSFVGFAHAFGFRPDLTLLNIILPVGISFYTFQSIAYVTDVHRGKTNPEPSALHYFSFICFFPQMVAGPIERSKHLLPQFHREKKWNRNYFESGLNLVAYGFFKKVVIADNLAVITNQIHSNIAEQNSFALFAGILCFAIQIYADFGGYTDIARGTARLLGFKLSRNFHFPYFASTFREFWKRWHISLSRWFRDYLYIPLGGNKGTQAKRNFNLLVTFLISGLWHGANFTFILWGLLHGLALSFEKKYSGVNLPKMLSRLVVFLTVAFLFTLFRSPDITHFYHYNQALFLFNTDKSCDLISYLESGYFFYLPLLFFVFMEFRNSGLKGLQHTKNNYLINLLLFLLILLFAVFENAPDFIYFQF